MTTTRKGRSAAPRKRATRASATTSDVVPSTTSTRKRPADPPPLASQPATKRKAQLGQKKTSTRKDPGGDTDNVTEVSAEELELIRQLRAGKLKLPSTAHTQAQAAKDAGKHTKYLAYMYLNERQCSVEICQ